MSGLSEQQREELRDWWDDGGDFSVDDWGPATLFPIVARMIADALAEQAAKVEALATEWESLPEPPGEDYEGTTEGHWAFGEWLATRQAAKQLRAALASEGTDALAKVRADELREAAKEARERGDIGKPGCVEVWDWLDARADRIARGDAR